MSRAGSTAGPSAWRWWPAEAISRPAWIRNGYIASKTPAREVPCSRVQHGDQRQRQHRAGAVRRDGCPQPPSRHLATPPADQQHHGREDADVGHVLLHEQRGDRGRAGEPGRHRGAALAPRVDRREHRRSPGDDERGGEQLAVDLEAAHERADTQAGGHRRRPCRGPVTCDRSARRGRTRGPRSPWPGSPSAGAGPRLRGRRPRGRGSPAAGVGPPSSCRRARYRPAATAGPRGGSPPRPVRAARCRKGSRATAATAAAAGTARRVSGTAAGPGDEAGPVVLQAGVRGGAATVLVMIRGCGAEPDQYLTSPAPWVRGTGVGLPRAARWESDQDRDL